MWSPRKADVKRFTEGDCHLFARALNKLTGWPIHAFICDPEDDYPDLHAFCVTPCGRAVDVLGVRPLDEIMEEWEAWGAVDHREFGWPLHHDWDVPIFGDYSRKRAALLAGRLVAHFQNEESPPRVSA